MQGDDIFFADQNLAPEAGESFSKNEVMFKFKTFLKVNFQENIFNFF